jgi:hypothetical protein
LIGMRSHDSIQEATTAPYLDATHASPPLNLVEQYDGCIMGSSETNVEGQQFSLRFNSTPSSLLVTASSGGSGHGQLIWRAGALWIVEPPNNIATVPLYMTTIGWNLGSRVLLASPVTKTSTQTMKITYTLNLPVVVP